MNPAQGQYLLLCLIGFGAIIGGMVYFFLAVYRIRSVADVMKVYQVMSLPNDDHRCKHHNQSHYVCLPNVFLIGASKCGTTSLLDYLLQHPHVARVRRRINPTDRHNEVHRFDRQAYGWTWPAIELADEWASSPLVSDKSTAVIHYTPHYLYAPTVPYEMRQFYPHPHELKFVINLREPIARALSSYWFQHSHLLKGTDQGSIREFEKIVTEDMRIRREYEHCMHRQQLQKPQQQYQHRHQQQHNTTSSANTTFRALKVCFGSHLRSRKLGSRHIDKGIYADQIRRWWDNFPRHNFHFISLHEWERNATAEYSKLIDFIFRDDHTHPSHYHHPSSLSDPQRFAHKRLAKPNALSRDSSQQLNPAFQKILYDFFLPYNQELHQMIGTTFPMYK